MALRAAQEAASALCSGHEEGANNIDPWLHPAMGRGKAEALDVAHTNQLDHDKNKIYNVRIRGYSCRDTDTPKNSATHVINSAWSKTMW